MRRNDEKRYYGANEWNNNLRGNLNRNYSLNAQNKEDWKTAVSIFSRRFNRYYLNPIEKLSEGFTGEGFVIVTAQCALIETFAAFKYGKIYDRDKGDQGFYYKDSKALFVKFLTTETSFNGVFYNNSQINCPFSAEAFYSKVRCGLIHESKTRGEWIINKDEAKYAEKHPNYRQKGTFIKENKDGKKIIFRNQLQTKLKRYFEEYKLNLLNESNEYDRPRRLFARKLDHLFDINETETYDWWVPDSDVNSEQTAEP